jgi:hypothetical protein
MSSEPNWDEIYAIAQRAELAYQSGQMDREAWMRLLDEAYAAARGNPDLTCFLSPYAKPEWVRDLLEPGSPRRKSVA